MKYDPVIGLEIHVQLATRTKLFCGCPVEFAAPPNRHVCPVCLGYPGALPVLNQQAVRYGIRAACAFECEVQSFTRFDRKNYFYPDSPKGYQISQLDHPYARGGEVRFTFEDGTRGTVPLQRIHLEDDAGKSIHDEGGQHSLIDLNRSGTPLLEVVTEPEIYSAEEASACLRAIRDVMGWIEVSDVNMEEGSLRCDVNVSLKPTGSRELGTRTEVKNLNSFTNVEKAIGVEIARHAEILDAGRTVVQETRLFDADRGVTQSMRGKEEAQDYRYFPDPDIPPLKISSVHVETERKALPVLPQVRRRNYEEQAGLSSYDAGLIVQSRVHADYFDAMVAAGLSAKVASNWFQTEVLRQLKEQVLESGRRGAGRGAFEAFALQPEQVAVIAKAVEEDRVSVATGRDVFRQAAETGQDPQALLAERGEQVSAPEALEGWVVAVLSENPDAVAKIREGDSKPIGFLVGQVMKQSTGRANPRLVAELIQKRVRDDS